MMEARETWWRVGRKGGSRVGRGGEIGDFCSKETEISYKSTEEGTV
jgi:hypothetical protein